MRRRSRRKVVIARDHGGAAGQASGALVGIDLLSNFKGSEGIAANLPGCTVQAVRYSLCLNFSSASAAGALDHICYAGILAGPDTLDTADMIPGTHIHLPWMDWVAQGLNSGASVNVPLTPYVGASGGAETGPFRMARSKRRLHNINDTVWLVISATAPAGTWAYDYSTSVVLALP